MLPNRLIILLLAFCSCAKPLAAQTVPTGMAYQGRLTDASNLPAPDGTGYEIDVRLWTTAAGGTQPIWAARYSNVPVKNGAFNLILGSPGGGALNGAIADLKTVFNTAPTTYIALTVNKSATGASVANPTEILPRQQLFSSSYAFRAAQAATVDSDAILSASIKNGEVATADLADGSVTNAKLASGSVTLASIAANTINSSAIAGNSIDADRLKLDYAKFVDEKPSNTSGGTYAQGWLKRTLNKTESTAGSSITRSGDIITLQPGVYWVCASVPAYHCDIIAYLRKVDGTNLMRGTYIYPTYSGYDFSAIQGPLVITEDNTSIEIWQYSPLRAPGNDRSLGFSAGAAGIPEQYTEISFLKIR